MIKKLRIKFIAASMISLILVLTTIIGITSFLNYKNIEDQADQKIDMLINNKGKFPEGIKGFSLEMPFESRYFTIVYNQDSIESVNTGRIASVNYQQAIEYANQVIQKKNTSGFIDTYRYSITTDQNGYTQICFLSCHRELEAFHTFLLNSIWMSIVGCIAVFILITLTSKRIIKPISDSYEKQKRFITDAGHELKTPLAIIQADAEILEMDDENNEWIQDIQTQTNRLSELTNQLVYLAKMEEQPQMEKVDFSLSDVVEDTVHDFQVLTKDKQLSSTIQKDIHISGDKKSIQQLIGIFLDNALKYTNENGEIHVTLEKNRGNIILQVWNSVPYIEKESVSHLFDRFYRTDSSRNSKNGGYGLGLSIASAIVQAHNGKIDAKTEDEKSLCITVTF